VALADNEPGRGAPIAARRALRGSKGGGSGLARV